MKRACLPTTYRPSHRRRPHAILEWSGDSFSVWTSPTEVCPANYPEAARRRRQFLAGQCRSSETKVRAAKT